MVLNKKNKTPITFKRTNKARFHAELYHLLAEARKLQYDEII